MNQIFPKTINNRRLLVCDLEEIKRRSINTIDQTYYMRGNNFVIDMHRFCNKIVKITNGDRYGHFGWTNDMFKCIII